MYYEQRVVNGVLCWRNLPNGEWYEFTAKSLTQKINKLELELEQLQNTSSNSDYAKCIRCNDNNRSRLCEKCIDEIRHFS